MFYFEGKRFSSWKFPTNFSNRSKSWEVVGIVTELVWNFAGVVMGALCFGGDNTGLTILYWLCRVDYVDYVVLTMLIMLYWPCCTDYVVLTMLYWLCWLCCTDYVVDYIYYVVLTMLCWLCCTDYVDYVVLTM